MKQMQRQSRVDPAPLNILKCASAAALMLSALILAGCDSTASDGSNIDQVLAGTEGVWFSSEPPRDRTTVPPPCTGFDHVSMEDGAEWCHTDEPVEGMARYAARTISAEQKSLEKISEARVLLRTVRVSRTWMRRLDATAPGPDPVVSGFVRRDQHSWESIVSGPTRSYVYEWSGEGRTFTQEGAPCISMTLADDRIVTRHKCSAAGPELEYVAYRADPFNVTF